jgi:hypothetical protein
LSRVDGFDIGIRDGELTKVWPRVYAREEPDTLLRLRGLDLRAGEPVAICLATAANAYCFGTEERSTFISSIPLVIIFESPMESEARLAMLDGGLPPPVLQHEIVDRNWRTWRVDFAWPDRLVAVEYDGFDWHSDPEKFRIDRQKRAALHEIGWTVQSIVADDVRRRSWDMVRRIEVELDRSRAA